MTTDAFKEYVKTCRALDTEEIHRFMDDMSNEARRITFRLNTAYHTRRRRGVHQCLLSFSGSWRSDNW